MSEDAFEKWWAEGHPTEADKARARYTWDAATMKERDRCEAIANEQAAGIRTANTFRGRVNQYAAQAADWCDSIAAAIRKGE